MEEEQRIQELLKPRWIITADYSGCGYEVGTILEPDDLGELQNQRMGYQSTECRIMIDNAGAFPHLIRKLEWYEERDDLPAYLKHKHEQRVVKVFEYKLYADCFRAEDQPNYPESLSNWLPATLADYNTYVSSQKINS